MSEIQENDPLLAEITAEEAQKVGAGETATVGGLLRAAREAAGLSVDDVAQSLKFGPRQIEFLEADDYAALPGNTVVRGFTRSYARLLGLDAAALLHLLDNRSPIMPADVRAPENMGIAADGARSITPLVSAAIVIALAAALLGLWQLLGPADRPSAPPQAVPQAASRSDAATSRADPSPPAAAPAEATAAESGPARPADAAPRMVFTFEDRSWLEVTDATHETLFSGENPAGSRVEITGKPPFDIVVGNAVGVRLSYGDRKIDLAPHTRVNVARFRLE